MPLLLTPCLASPISPNKTHSSSMARWVFVIWLRMGTEAGLPGSGILSMTELMFSQSDPSALREQAVCVRLIS
jgi:hypothetical protein